MSSIMEEIAASTASWDVISHWIGVIFPFPSAEVAAAASKFISTAATFAPAALRPIVIALPRPLPAPVTMQILPLRSLDAIFVSIQH